MNQKENPSILYAKIADDFLAHQKKDTDDEKRKYKRAKIVVARVLRWAEQYNVQDEQRIIEEIEDTISAQSEGYKEQYGLAGDSPEESAIR